MPCHFFRGSEGAQVPGRHLRVGASVIDVHGVVLTALHDAIFVLIPDACPGKTHGLFDVRPHLDEFVVISRQLPLAIHLDQGAHLAIGRPALEAFRAHIKR